jgi:hypothetical protein
MLFDLSSMHIIESLQPELETLKMQQCIFMMFSVSMWGCSSAVQSN